MRRLFSGSPTSTGASPSPRRCGCCPRLRLPRCPSSRPGPGSASRRTRCRAPGSWCRRCRSPAPGRCRSTCSGTRPPTMRCRGWSELCAGRGVAARENRRSARPKTAVPASRATVRRRARPALARTVSPPARKPRNPRAAGARPAGTPRAADRTVDGSREEQGNSALNGLLQRLGARGGLPGEVHLRATEVAVGRGLR